MDADEYVTAARGLRRYGDLVAGAVGVPVDACYVDTGVLATAYLPMPGHLPGYPGREFALLWDEENGWAGAVESGCGEDLLVVAYLGADVLPDPVEVGGFARALLAGRAVGRLVPPRSRCAGVADDLPARLTALAHSALPEPRVELVPAAEDLLLV